MLRTAPSDGLDVSGSHPSGTSWSRVALAVVIPPPLPRASRETSPCLISSEHTNTRCVDLLGRRRQAGPTSPQAPVSASGAKAASADETLGHRNILPVAARLRKQRHDGWRDGRGPQAVAGSCLRPGSPLPPLPHTLPACVPSRARCICAAAVGFAAPTPARNVRPPREICLLLPSYRRRLLHLLLVRVKKWAIFVRRHSSSTLSALSGGMLSAGGRSLPPPTRLPV